MDHSGIGDIHSDARGSGARYNSGKVPLNLLPISVSTDLFTALSDIDESFPPSEPWIQAAYHYLGLFQETHDPVHLAHIISAVYEEAPEGSNPLHDAARVFEYGTKKYKEWNWAKGMPWSVPVACIARHLDAMDNGEELDHESGLPIRGHIMCNIIMLATYAHNYPEGDDLPPKGLLRGDF